jgi:hypothetical protein
MSRYDVVFAGRAADGREESEVKAAMARAFRSDLARIETMFAGQEVVIKRELDREEAERYLAALQKMGALCRLAQVGMPEIAAANSTAQVPSDPFAQWAHQRGENVALLPYYIEFAQIHRHAAASSRLSSELVDSVIWQEEKSGSARFRVELLRRVGYRLLEYQSEEGDKAVPADESDQLCEVSELTQPSASSTAISFLDQQRTANPPIGPGLQRIRDLLEFRLQIFKRKADESAREADGLTVSEVANMCPASVAGIRPGDRILAINGEEPTLGLASSYRVRCCTFYSETQGLVDIVAAKEMNLGLSAKRSAQMIWDAYDVDEHDAGDLVALWELGEYEAIAELTEDLLGPEYTDRNNPVYLLIGAARYELGDRERGRSLVEVYMKHHVDSWTLNYAAIGWYYLARIAQDSGRNGIAELRQSYNQTPLDRVIDALQRLTGQRPPKNLQQLVGRPFPVNYVVSRNGQQEVRLRDCCAKLKSGELLLVCLLGNYRGNGPYSSFMDTYIRIASGFGDFVKGLHVLSESYAQTMPSQYSHYLDGERRVIAAGLPFLLLDDPKATIGDACKATCSPFVVALDRRGIVRGEHVRGGLAIWNAIAEAALAE